MCKLTHMYHTPDFFSQLVSHVSSFLTSFLSYATLTFHAFTHNQCIKRFHCLHFKNTSRNFPSPGPLTPDVVSIIVASCGQQQARAACFITSPSSPSGKSKFLMPYESLDREVVQHIFDSVFLFFARTLITNMPDSLWPKECFNNLNIFVVICTYHKIWHLTVLKGMIQWH